MTTPAISVLAEALLAAAQGSLSDPPVASYLSHNAPAWDICRDDQLTVHLANLAFRQSKGPRQSQSVPAATLVVQLVRCVPGQGNGGQAPSTARLHDSATSLMADLDAIQQAVRADAEAIFGGAQSVTWGQAVPLGPNGQVGGYSWPIVVELSGQV